ncbi:MAG: flagellar hook-associated protein FlgL [Armatimonadota bacterium]
MNRVSTSYQYNSSQSQIQKSGNAYFAAQRRVSTGRRINDLGDDPTGVSNIISMSSVKAGLAQYSANLDRANSRLASTENSFAEVTTLLNRANALTVSGATATIGQNERQAMASEMTSIRDRLVQLANSKDGNGDYIFAGTAVKTTPFSVASGVITYNGDLGSVKVEAAPGQTMDLTISGSQSFFTTAFDTLTTTITALQNNDTASLSNASLTNIQASLQTSNQYRGEIGNRMRTVTDYQFDQTRRIEELTKGVSDVTDVDLAQAITDYQSAQTAYQAALQMAGQGNKLSLMDFIRG